MFLILDISGSVQGVTTIAQDMAQGMFVGMTQIEVADDDDRVTTYLAAIKVEPAPKPTPRQWLERLPPATQGAITQAAATDTTGAILLWLLKAAGTPTIDVTAAETQQGVQALVAAGVLTADDQALLLAP
jgi:hypothetical protein